MGSRSKGPNSVSGEGHSQDDVCNQHREELALPAQRDQDRGPWKQN